MTKLLAALELCFYSQTRKMLRCFCPRTSLYPHIPHAVAVAPKNTTRRVPSLRELDEDLKYSVPSAADGLDMSLLTKTLVPPEMVK